MARITHIELTQRNGKGTRAMVPRAAVSCVRWTVECKRSCACESRLDRVLLICPSKSLSASDAASARCGGVPQNANGSIQGVFDTGLRRGIEPR